MYICRTIVNLVFKFGVESRSRFGLPRLGGSAEVLQFGARRALTRASVALVQSASSVRAILKTSHSEAHLRTGYRTS